ncbi:hypothetical protein [Microtetraspora malaysiensis]|uniref:hypothetical protein n=1 Tax=Microtetraspora malaysiensis TaxID=161358 RepID=UPI003D8B6FDD
MADASHAPIDRRPNNWWPFPGFGYREAGSDRGFGQIDRPRQRDDLRHRHLNLGTGLGTGTGPGLGPCANTGTGPSASVGLGPSHCACPNTGTGPNTDSSARLGLGSARHLPYSRGQPLGTSQQVDDVTSGQVQVGPIRYPAITTSSIRASTVLAVTGSAACTSVSAVGGSAPASCAPAIPTIAPAITTSGRTITLEALASVPAIGGSIATGPPVTATPTHILLARAVPLPIIPTGTQGTVRG